MTCGVVDSGMDERGRVNGRIDKPGTDDCGIHKRVECMLIQSALVREEVSVSI